MTTPIDGTGTRSMRAGLVILTMACVPGLALAATCTTGKPTPVAETWSAASFTSNKAKFTIYTGPTDHGSQLQIASGIEGALWVAMTNNAAILKLTTTGAATIYATPTTDSAPEAIAENGKKMWFTEWNTPCAGSIDSAGKIVEYLTNAAMNRNMSTGMATGLNNTTWFVTDEMGIGKISNRGKITIYPIPDPSSQPTAITLGPDGNMWFVEVAGDNVGKITPDGVVTEYNAGFDNGSGGFGIAAGSDGRIWFVDATQRRIDAINTDGTGLVPYSTGLTGAPLSITAGSDGNLYFGETTPVIGRITTAGVITEYPITASEGSFPVISLTSGPDKNVWFSNNSHSQVGMLKVPIK